MAPGYTIPILITDSTGYYLQTLDTSMTDPMQPTATDTYAGPAFTYTILWIPDTPQKKPKQYQNYKYCLIHYKVNKVQCAFINQSHKNNTQPLARYTKRHHTTHTNK